MEDVMFVHKSKPVALSFAAAAMVISLAAQPAQANGLEDYQQDDYCSAPEVCDRRQIGIIQKERDGVNYFYGGSDVPAPEVSYIYLRDDDIEQPVEPIRISNVNESNFQAPLSNHRFRIKKNHWRWHKRHRSPLDLPGLHPRHKFMGP
jgi:hypothetical protein